ncbi:MAG: hypothetical protein OXF86_19325 [Caldilineaceae bacterium]|nr:hypothetical protein [Caldilineaceae bacterium]
MATEIGKATARQVRDVLNMLVSGITSDVSSMEQIAGSWWRRFLFMRWFGPRFLGKQMDTFVATEGDRIIGFVIVQYDGDAAGTFDWAFVEPLEIEENREDFADLVDAALDHIEYQGIHPYFYFGFATASPSEVTQVLTDLGLGSADYQNSQMVGELPLKESPSLPEDFRIAPQISARFGPRMSDLLPSVYPDAAAEETEMIAAIHSSTLRSSKVFLVLQEGNEVGFVQQFRWRDELRLLFALPPALWDTDTERQIVAHMASTLQGNTNRLRLRTFSDRHLNESRQSLESLGLDWQQAPWQRWVVALEAEELGGGTEEQEKSRKSRYDSVWPPEAPDSSQDRDVSAEGQFPENDDQETGGGNEEKS